LSSVFLQYYIYLEKANKFLGYFNIISNQRKVQVDNNADIKYDVNRIGINGEG